MIFLGQSKVAKSYTDILPMRFSDYGTNCWFEGAKAVLFAKNPDHVSVDDLARFERIVIGRAEELRHIVETSAVIVTGDVSERPTGKQATSGEVANTEPVGVWVAVAVQPMFEASKGVMKRVVEFVLRKLNSGKRRRAYLKLQYRYVLDRFLKDEFDTFRAGVEGT